MILEPSGATGQGGSLRELSAFRSRIVREEAMDESC